MEVVETKEKMMKLHLADAHETVWAVELEDNTCRIDNLPFFSDVCGYNDIVCWQDVCGIRTFVGSITKVTESWGVTWKPTSEEKEDREWEQICDHLRSLELHFESMMAGAFVIALPVKDGDQKNWTWLKAICYSCPIKLTPYKGGDPNNADIEDSDS